MPDRVVLLAQSRIELHGLEERRLLEAASVFGREFSLGGVRALLPADVFAGNLQAIARDLTDSEFIFEQETSRLGAEKHYQFASGLLRDAAYSLLEDQQRDAAHLRAAAWLETNGEGDPLTIAMHFTLGGEVERARRYYLLAAEQALGGDDLEGALSCAEEGLAAGARGHDAVRLRLVHAEASKWRGDNAQCFRSAQAAFARAEEGSHDWCRAAAEAAVAAGKTGKPETSLAIAKELLAATPSEQGKAEHTVALCRIACQMVLTGNTAMGSELIDVACAGDDRIQPDPHVMGFIAEAQALLHGATNDPVGRISFATRATIHFEDAGDLRNSCLLRLSQGFAEIELGANESAISTLTEALRLATEIGLENSLPVAQAQLGRAHARTGDGHEALTLLQQAATAFDHQKNVRMAGIARVYLAEAHLILGQPELALDASRRATAILQPAPPLKRCALAYLAVSEAALGNAEAAAAAAEEAVLGLLTTDRLPAGESLVRVGAACCLLAGENRRRAQEILKQERLRVLELAETMPQEQAGQFLHGCPARAALIKGLPDSGAAHEFVSVLRSFEAPKNHPSSAIDDLQRETSSESGGDSDWSSISVDRRAEIARIIDETDPVLRNLNITQSYHGISRQLASVIDHQNANWATFACWASLTAGFSIQNREIPHFFENTFGLAQGSLRHVSSFSNGVLGMFGISKHLRQAAREVLDEVSTKVAEGNLRVYEELAPVFERYYLLLRANPSEAEVVSFTSEFTAGRIENGGQELLKKALMTWFRASRTDDPKARAELILRANCQIGLHEQTRLQPFIEAAMLAPIDVLIAKRMGKKMGFLGGPFALLGKLLLSKLLKKMARAWEHIATRHAMNLALPQGQEISLGETPVPGSRSSYPEDLQVIDDPKTEALLERFDEDLSSPRGAGANNWANLRDRMGFIVELFRARQQELSLFSEPFEASQLLALREGKIPAELEPVDPVHQQLGATRQGSPGRIT